MDAWSRIADGNEVCEASGAGGALSTDPDAAARARVHHGHHVAGLPRRGALGPRFGKFRE